MRTRLIGIGNSRGLHLPKPLIEQVGLVDEVDLRVEDGTIVISPARAPRAGWAEAAARLAATESSALIDPPSPTRFEDDEWQW